MHPELQELIAERGDQLRRRARSHDPTGPHDRDPVGQPLGLVEVMRREQDRHLAPVPETSDHIQQFQPDPGIQPDGRFVEEEHGGLGDERASDLQPPALSAAVRSDGPVDQLGQREGLHDLLEPPGDLPDRDAPQTGVDLQVPSTRQRAVHHRILEQDAADPPRGERLGGDVEPGEPRVPPGRRDRPGEHADRGRLARTVGPQEAEHLTGPDIEVHTGDCFDAAREDLAQASDLDRGSVRHNGFLLFASVAGQP